MKKFEKKFTVLIAGIALLFGAMDVSNVKSAVDVAGSSNSIIEIEGFQISPSIEGFRTVYSIENYDQAIEEVGLIYGIKDECNPQDMIVGSSSDAVVSCKATTKGKIAVSMHDDGKKDYLMAMTLMYGNSSTSFLSTKLSVRAYAKYIDGSFKYSNIETSSIYDTADVLYRESSMPAVADHNYLYNSILKKVNNNYASVNYGDTPQWDTVSYVVIFKDYYGNVAKTEIVEKGESATAPTLPEVPGYSLVGWNKNFDNITSNVVISPIYEEISNALMKVSNVQAHAGDEEVIVSISISNNPGILGMILKLNYNDDALELVSATNGDAFSMLSLTKSKVLQNGCNFVWDGVELTPEDIRDGEVLLLKFRVLSNASTGRYPIKVSAMEDSIVDNNLQMVEVGITNGYIEVN